MSNTEVFKQMLALLDTLSEGLDHASILIADTKLDEAFEMLYDILTGIDSIISALKPYKEQFSASDLQNLESVLLDRFNKAIDIFKMNEVASLENYIKSTLIPAFAEWKREIEKLLMPLVLS